MFGLMVKNNLNMFSSIKILDQIGQDVALQVNSVNNTKKIIEDLKWHF